MRNSRQDTNLTLLRAFREHGCSLCEERESRVIEAHHVNPADKLFNLGNTSAQKVNEFTFAAEVSKCIPLCPTCHRKVTLGIIEIPQSVLEDHHVES